MKTDRPHWSQVLKVVRHEPRSIPSGTIPTNAGVYVWFRDGAPVSVGEARGAQGLRGRLRAHLATGTDLSRSTLRASVAVAELGVTRAYVRQRPSVMTPTQILRINDWLGDCELGWLECRTSAEAHALEVGLRSEWLPPPNIM
jgi:hypothetical protein